MDKIRVHAEKKCRKFLTPAAKYSPVVQHWYNRIHTYIDLLKLKQGKRKYTNKDNVRRSARRRDIKNPTNLTLEEIQDALRYCRIRDKSQRPQEASQKPHETHLRNCLISAHEKKDKERARAIKQKMDREENTKMWTNIKYVVKDPQSSQVLKVQRLQHGVVCKYTDKEEVERVVQEECEARFTLAHSAPIMKHSLARKLRYLEDKDIARAIVDGTHEIPPKIDKAAKYILQEIGNMGRETSMGEGHEITITANDFRTFWKRVSEWTTSSSSSIHYGHYKAAVKMKVELVSKINAQQLTVIARSGVAPVRWGMSLQVLLEKLT